MNDLICRLVIEDLAIVGFTSFLKEKGLEKEGQEYVKRFIESIKKEDFENLAEKLFNSLKEEAKK